MKKSSSATTTRDTLPFRFTRKMTALLLAGVAGIAGLLLGMHWLSGNYQQDMARSAGLRAETKQIEVREAQLAAGVDPLADLVQRAQRADQYLPASTDKAGLAANLPRSARQRGLLLKQLEPGVQTAAGATVSYLPVTVTVTGAYRDIVAWISDLRAPGAVRSVSDLNVTKEDSSRYRATFTLRVWASTTPPLPTGQGTAKISKPDKGP